MAGGQSGGGGFSLLCDRDAVRTSQLYPDKFGGTPLRKGQLIDLWLAAQGKGPFRKEIGKLRIIRTNEPVAVQVRKALAKIKSRNPAYGELIEQALRHISKRREAIPSGYQIVANNDTDVSSIPSGCHMRGVGRYSDLDDYLEYDPYVLEQMKDTDQLGNTDLAAFDIHEAIYLVKRHVIVEPTTSRSTQLEVGLLFSDRRIVPFHMQGTTNVYHCQSGLNPVEDSFLKARTSFIVGIKNSKVMTWSSIMPEGPYTSSGKMFRKANLLFDEAIGFDDTPENAPARLAAFRSAVQSGKVTEYVNSREFNYDGFYKGVCKPLVPRP